MSKKFFSLVMFLAVTVLMSSNAFAAARSNDNVWQVANTNLKRAKTERFSSPDAFKVFRLNKDALNAILRSAPNEYQSFGLESEITMTLPMPDGSFQRFTIKESPIMEYALAVKFPEIKTYLGQGIDDPTASARFDFTPDGFHAIVLSKQGTIYVDPYAKNDTDNYVSFNKSALRKKSGDFVCEVGGNSELDFTSKSEYDFYPDTANVVTNGSTLRQYRLALAATGEYTTAVGGTVSAAMTAQVTTMNRVNAIYERELAVRMNIIANNNLIIYTNGATDPYTNTNGVAMLGENQTNLTTVIGPANNDIGHVFSTGGGGVATLYSPCNASTKAQGVTGSPNPTGDAFDVDYVAHEIGHQFGGNHTFNNDANGSCGGNRNASTAFEPGSGSTIQAYAGICGSQNIQANSNDYFHVGSLEEMVAFITNFGTCSSNTSSGNVVPTVTVAGGTTFNIPRDTPFALTANGSDGNGDALTYTWEEYSLGAAGVPSGTANAPMFRSYSPSASPTRTFPSLNYILNNNNVAANTYTGTSPTGAACGGTCLNAEFLPSITRTIPFQVTARDNRAGGGGVASAMASVVVDAGSGPFKVTAQDTSVTSWQSGSTQTVTWNVANTTAAPVSAANVNILLSTDGGQTFPFVLAANTPNDGSQNITVPNVITTTARLKVEAAGNIFFDISNMNFSITAPLTAANVSISGRVLNSNGNGISKALITVTDAVTSESRVVLTNPFGYFAMTDLQIGTPYIINVQSKGYTFPNNSQVFNLSSDLADISFVGVSRSKSRR